LNIEYRTRNDEGRRKASLLSVQVSLGGGDTRDEDGDEFVVFLDERVKFSVGSMSGLR
jgi:hypothetical protein